MKPITLEWITIAEGDWETANRESNVDARTNFRAISFHAQQCGEKYLKAYLQEKSTNPERTHSLQFLLNKILPYEPTWTILVESCLELTEFAVDHRYPGTTTSKEQADNALKYAGDIRRVIRDYFGLGN